jgi:sugar transferase (PEP-CTERM system associated)
VNGSPLAVSAEEHAAVVPQRYVSLRLFNGHVHRLALLALAETAVVILAVHLAVFVRFQGFAAATPALQLTAAQVWPRVLLIALVFLLSLAALGLYQLRHRASFNGALVRVGLAVVLAEIALALIFYLAPSLLVGRGVTLLIGAFAFVGFAFTRSIFLRLVDEEFFKRRVLVWGAGVRAASIERRLRRRTDRRGFRVMGYVQAPGDGEDGPGVKTVHAPGELVRLALQHRVEEIVVAMDDRRAGFPAAELLECRLRGIYVTDIVTFLEKQSGRVSVELTHPSWLIFSDGFRCDIVRVATKRVFDIVVSIGILLVTLPIWLLVMLAIKLEDGGPVFYRQIRTGQNGRLVPLLKFRSMRVDAETEGEPLWASPNDLRITRVGALIRRLRVDELPQVLNVLVGHMSFVGPRPERPAFVEELARTIPFYRERHFVKPGITGWAQVRYSYGSSRSDAQQKLEYDLYYVKHHSLVFDLMVLLQTVEIILFRIGSR